jgi:hypothetical protein
LTDRFGLIAGGLEGGFEIEGHGIDGKWKVEGRTTVLL